MLCDSLLWLNAKINAFTTTYPGPSLVELRASTPGKLGGKICQKDWQYSDAVVPLRNRKQFVHF
jgi:hypothetical protein